MVQVQLIINYKLHATLEESFHHNGNPQGARNYLFCLVTTSCENGGMLGLIGNMTLKLLPTSKKEQP
jgi:hypothetical protein